MSAATTSAAAAAAAAEQHHRMAEEEEEMTPYPQQELSQDWEFKIIRSATGGFRKPDFLRQCLDEEARAGWVLVEKFDDGRLRLKRPAAARERDGKLDVDPYRTFVGPTPNAVAVAIVALIIGTFLAVIGVIAILANVR